MQQWSLYIIETAQGTLYTGITTDVKRRFDEHCNSKQGAKYLKGKGPLTLRYHCEVGSKSRASKLEYRVKALKKSQKELLIKGAFSIDSLIESLKH